MNIVSFLNSYSEGKSGGDICFIEIFKRIDNKNLTVMTSSLGKKLCRDEGLEGNFILTTHEKKFTSTIWTYCKRIWIGSMKAFKIKKVDIIYGTSDALPDVIPALILKLRFRRSKWINKVFHLIPNARIISSVSQQISHFILKNNVDRVIVDNTELKHELVTQGFRNLLIEVNYPGISKKTYKKTTSVYDAVFMSRIHESKGVFDLIHIWRKVVDEIPYAKLAIIGEGNNKIMKQLRTLILNQKLKKHISLLGFLPDEDAFSTIASSNVFLFPSHEEGFGLTVGEVLACNVPVITYDLPVFEETFKPAIITIPCFDEELFAEKIVSLLKKKESNSMNSKAIKQIVHSFTWEKTAQKELLIMKS